MSRISVATSAGSSLSVVVHRPSGPLVPVLLVHGLASNARLWDGVGSALAGSGHPVAAVDQRGHGLSSKPAGGYDFETLSADLDAVIETLGYTSPVLAGQSWGGNVVLHHGATRAGAASGLVLVDGGTIDLPARYADWPTCAAALAPPPLAGTPAADFERMIRSHHPDWPDTGIAGTLANMEVLADGTIRPWLSREHHMQILRNLWDNRPGPWFAAVRAPVLMIMASSASDPRWMAAKREEVRTASAALARSSVEWIEGDHDLHAEFPDRVASSISAFAAAAVAARHP